MSPLKPEEKAKMEKMAKPKPQRSDLVLTPSPVIKMLIFLQMRRGELVKHLSGRLWEKA